MALADDSKTASLTACVAYVLGGYDLTLVEAEALEDLAAGGVELAPAEARRNLVVKGIALDDLVGRRFRVGEVECFGQRRCEPCSHLEKLTRPGVLRGLVHRGGLRADVMSSGEIRAGDRIEALPQGQTETQVSG